MDRRNFIAAAVAATSTAALAAEAGSGKGLKIIGVSCSPRKGMTTSRAVQAALEAAQAVDPRIQAELIDLGGFQAGFLHEKVMLIDEACAVVGTANFDNRSFRLNFEIMAVVLDRPFAAEVEAMFRRDLGQSREVTREELEQTSFWFRVLSRAAYLMAPVQ